MINLKELSAEELKDIAQRLRDLSVSITNGEADRFLTEKGQNALDNIMRTENIDSDQRASDYKDGNKVQVSTDHIKFYNDSEIDIGNADTWINDYGKQFYPETLSLADLIEYGAGQVGANNANPKANNWEYMANPNRDYDEGWKWNNQGTIEHTFGQAGRYIYFQLGEEFNQHSKEWIDEFVEKKMGGKV